MSATYKEQDFETHIVEHLTDAARGDGQYVQRESSDYDKELCLIPDEVITFVKATQPKAYEKLQGQYGEETDRNLCLRLKKNIQRWGTLKVLREGIKDRGAKIRLVYFRPSSTFNPEHEQLYQQNRLGVVRQLHYSTKHPGRSLDLGLFINGIPIFTAELKNSLTGQFVREAKKQYKKRRRPPEPLFQFKRCLAHFAVGNEEVHYTTELRGDNTYFLPFNKAIENPPNPTGHKTAYLWETVWQKDSLLDLLENYLCVQVDKEKVYDPQQDAIVTEESETLIFPRYHQLDVVRKLLRVARDERAGHNYLVQHSAGSGKSNSIAWLAHGLRQLYQSGDRLFDTIIVVTDRRVLDQQLQSTIKQFEQTAGTVVPITKTSQQLKESLEKGKDILITTIQKFPVISEAMSELDGNRFAVVVDEAHSGQTGENAKHLKQALSAPLEEAEDEDETDVDLEDEIVQEIRARGKQAHISYFAFTATPKNKTLELFGRKNEEGDYVPFHVYSMRQAIEERFILDVLENYATFKRYFKLAKAIEEDKEYETRKAVRALTSYVDLQPHAIHTKTQICLDHFLDVTADAINGKGRAMLVTRSRLHCVRYYLALKKLMKERAPVRAACGLLWHSRRPGHRSQAHREQPEPTRTQDRHPGCHQAAEIPHSHRRQQIPDGIRLPAASHHVGGQKARGRIGRADALPAQPHHVVGGQDRGGRARFRERGRGHPERLPGLLPDDIPDGGDGPEQAVRPRSRAAQLGDLHPAGCR